MTLSLEEDILLSAGLLTPDYDPESELEEGQKHLSLEERKEDLEDAREAFKEVKGRVQKIAWEGGQPWEVGKDVPSMPSLKVAHIFGSMRENLPVAYVLGDMRVYCEPKQSLPGDGYRLIVINRASPAVLHEPLTRDSFIDEIALEIRHQLREECAECHKVVQHDDEVCGHCGAGLEEEEDEVSEASEEEGEIPSVVAEVVAPAEASG